MPAATFYLVLFSAVLHACWNLAARKAGGRFGVVWVGLAAASLLGLPFCLRFVDDATRGAAPQMAATAALNAVYFVALARAYQVGELAEVYPLTRGTGVAGAALLASWLLGEPLGSWGAGGVALVCAGLWLVTRGGKASSEGRAWPWALSAGACIFTSAVIDKTAMRAAHPFPYIVALFGGSAIFLAPLAWARRGEVVAAARRELPLSLAIGGGSMLSYGLILHAMRSGPLGLVAAARESSVVFGALLGVLFLGEKPTRVRMMGVLAVAGGLICVRLA